MTSVKNSIYPSDFKVAKLLKLLTGTPLSSLDRLLREMLNLKANIVLMERNDHIRPILTPPEIKVGNHILNGRKWDGDFRA